ncbi:FAD-dependent oxidoreductase [Pseudonocardia sp. CA-142604]|uniref:FAD-dependent oxidoreductase n=1 Tax=Pseudonocardia sp. CA-142604 TaxID=3240024 RepID=UPI003D8E4E2A
MARIVVIGAGLTGLATALLLARDGHDVTVLERDPAEPDGDAESLWRNWERPGVSQFRLPHQMLAYWRRLMERELPEVIDEVERLGGRRINPIDTMPVALTGGIRAGDEDLRGMSARRPVLEGALSAVAARAQGVTVRRGARVAALVPAPPGVHGVPHVGGVVIDAGEKLSADLVVDAMGRNTSVDRMLGAIGARRPDEQAEELGFVYYCRQFRNNEPGSVPLTSGLIPYEGMSLLTIYGDADTYSLCFYVASNDRELRGLRDVDAWERALALFPNLGRLRSVSTPITGIQVMAGSPDRRRSFVVDGAPVVTGLVAVGDAVVRTNPSLGRGSATGLVQACTLRDVLRDVGPDRSDEFATRFAEAIEAVVGPLYRRTLAQDRNRMAEIQADIAGTPHRPTGATWQLQRALQRLVRMDADALRIYMRSALHIEPLDPAVFPATLRAKIEAVDDEAPPYPAGGPTRAQLLAAVADQPIRTVA